MKDAALVAGWVLFILSVLGRTGGDWAVQEDRVQTRATVQALQTEVMRYPTPTSGPMQWCAYTGTC